MIEIIDEKYLENSVSSVPLSGIEKILFQMKKCICKIYQKDGTKGTGFFCKIPFPDEDNLLPVLITNNHVIGQNDLTNHNIIEITLNNEKEERKIKISSKRITFTSQELDITFIEINPHKDNINDFLEIEDLINSEMKSLEKFYRKKSIYILHYPKGKDIEVSYGQINSINDFNINHTCLTDKGSSGSPILSLDKFKIVGIHKGSTNFQLNRGIFIKNAINALYNQYKNNFKFISHKEKTKNEMTINYSIGDYEYIRIFSKKFVENNKNNCKIIVNGKDEIDLCEYIDKNNLKSKNKTLEIKLIEKKTITDMSYMFLDCRRLTFIENLNWNTIKVNDMSYMFSSCLNLQFLPDISNWNTSNVTNMKGMFELCISLSSIPDISQWDTSSVTDIKYLFNRCFSLIELPDISKWSISNVTDLTGIFYECISIKSLPNISVWNTSNVTNMSYLFNKCSSLKTLPDISVWDTSKVTNMSYMFNECSSLKTLQNISNWNIDNVTNKSCIFNGCKKLSYIPEKFKEQNDY